MQDPTSNSLADEQPEASEGQAEFQKVQPETKDQTSEEAISIPEESVAEAVETEPAAETEEALPKGPSFGKRLQETFASVRKRVGAVWEPLGERIGTTASEEEQPAAIAASATEEEMPAAAEETSPAAEAFEAESPKEKPAVVEASAIEEEAPAPAKEAPSAVEPVAEAIEAETPEEEPPTVETAAVEEEAPAHAEKPVAEAVEGETAEEALPKGPSFGGRLQETFASVRERLGAVLGPLGERIGATLAPLRERLQVALGPFGERLGATLAPLRERMGDNAWIYGVIGVVIVLLILALFIPPFSLLQRLGITGYTAITAETDNNNVEHPDGIRVAIPATYEGKLRVRLDSVPRADFLGPSRHSQYRDAVEALPAHLEVKSPFYKIRTRGKNDQQVIIDTTMPAAAEPWETLDIYTWTGEAWEWVGSELHTEVTEKEFIRAWVTDIPDNVVVVQSKATAQTISAQVEAGDNLASGAGVVDEVNLTGLAMGTDGVIIGVLSQVVDVDTFTVMPVISEPSAHGPLADVLAMSDMQKSHIAQVVELCDKQGFAGVEIDYRSVLPEERDAYTAYITALADALHDQGLRLNVAVEPATFTGAEWNTGGYDWHAIGAVADAVKVPFPDDPAAYVESGEAQRLLAWATAQVPRSKLRMQVSSLSVEQRGGETAYVSMDDALAPFGEVTTVDGETEVAPNNEIKFTFSGIESVRGIVPQDAAGTYRIEYTADDDTTYTVWLGTAANLAVKLQWAQRYHLGGIAVNDLLNPGNALGIVEAVNAYRAATTPPTGQQVQVVWMVTSPAAELAHETLSLTDPNYNWMVVAATGTYTVKATIAGVERGSIEVAVAEAAAPTPTPTRAPAADTVPALSGDCLKASFVSETVPDGTKFEKGEDFTKSWTLSNSGTCVWPENTALVKISSDTGGADSVTVGTLAVGASQEIKVDLTAPDEDGTFNSKWALRSGDTQLAEVWAVITVGEGGGGSPVVPIAYTGGFELGGQTHTLANPDKMHYAGMTWVKFQHKWGPGDSPSAVQGKIDAAHANGFKVLLSIPGAQAYPTSIDFSSYVGFVGGVAALGPDAIEIWNEQNIDFEWPMGQISPDSYVNNMLAPAYNAIKAANPNVMVISGAPAPTGYFGGCGPNGCDDAPYIAGILAAGGANYADCVGVHYNEGILPPSQTSGDPRGNSSHYTRYYWGMVNAYYNAFGGQRPLCFTELGYLTPDGYGALPAKYAWAADTSVTEHAAWLTEAASLSASSGKVRMMIIFSVDIFHWGTDPQGGYAIIRPNGSCPACDSLHNVLGSR
jgi:hypothetical protein